MARGKTASKAMKQAREGKQLSNPDDTRAALTKQGVGLNGAEGGATGADAVAMAERLRVILEYRKMGATLEQIGQKFDLTPGRVHQLIADAIARLPKQAAEDVKQLELERLDAMQFSLWSAALKGDIGAITTILSIMTRRARYLGLDEPEAVDASVVMTAASDDARNALLGRLLTIKERMDAAAAPSPAQHAALPAPAKPAKERKRRGHGRR